MPKRFTAVRGLIEVDDSLVIVHDVPDRSIWMVNFNSGSRTPFSRERGEARAPQTVAHDARVLAPAEWQQFVDSSRCALLKMFNSGPSMVGALTSLQVRVPEAPTLFPPVAADRTRRVLTDGDMLWIPVNRDVANAHQQWDVLRADGTVFARYEMPPNLRLVAVSARYVYTVETLEDALQVLMRWRRAEGLVAGEGAE